MARPGAATASRPPASGGRRSGRPAVRSGRSLVLLAAVLVVVVLASQLPSPLYVLYADRLGLGATAITVLFAAYAVGVLLALLTCGHLSDRCGRRPVVALGLVAVLLSDACFVAGADRYPLLLVGRFLCGVAVALVTGAAAAGIVELVPDRWRSGAGQLSGVATMLGGGGGALLAGAVAEWLVAPTTTAYVAHAVLVAAAAAGLLVIPETVTARGRARPGLPRIGVPEGLERAFAIAAAAGFCGFAVLGLVSALTGSFLREGLHEPSHLLAGAVPLLMAAAAIVAPVAVRGRLSAVATQRAGLVGLAPGLGLLVLAIGIASPALFLAAMVVVGAAFGGAFQGALARLHGTAGTGHAELFSAFYVAAYAGLMLPVIGEGVLADALDLTLTVGIFAAVIATLAAATVLVDLGLPRPPAG